MEPRGQLSLAISAALALAAGPASGQFAWTGAAGTGLWSTPGNWNPLGPPVAGSFVSIPAGTPRPTASGVISVDTIDAQRGMLVNGTMTVSTGGTFVDLTLNTTTIFRPGTSIARGAFLWDNGIIQGGSVQVDSGATLGMYTASVTLDNCSLTNGAQVIQEQQLTVRNGATVTNAGLWSISAGIVPDTGASQFTNSGQLVKVGAGNASITVPYSTSNGTVEVQGGELRFAGPGFHGGTYSVGSLGTLRFLAGSSDQLTFRDNTLFTGGRAVLDGGAIVIDASRTLTFNCSPGELSAPDLDVRGQLVNDQLLRWTDGLVRTSGSGTFVNSGILAIDAASPPTLRALRLTNTGTVVQSGSLRLESGAVLANGGVWVLRSGGISRADSSDVRVENSGGLDATAEDTVDNVSIGVPCFHNGGLVSNSSVHSFILGGTVAHEVRGTVEFSTSLISSTTATAPHVVRQGATLSITGGGRFSLTGAWTLEDGAAVTAAMSGQAGLNGVLMNGSLQGAGVFANTGAMSLGAGPVSLGLGGTGGLINAAGGAMEITATHTLSGRLTNQGTLRLNAPAIILSGSNSGLINSGTFVLAGSVNGTGTLENTGLISREASGTSTISTPLDNQGEVRADGGSIVMTGPVVQLSGDTLTGGIWSSGDAGTISFNGRAVHRIAPGATLELHLGDYALPASPDLSLETIEGNTTIEQPVAPRTTTLSFSGPAAGAPPDFHPVGSLGEGASLRWPNNAPGTVRIGSPAQAGLPGGFTLRWQGSPGNTGLLQYNGVLAPGHSPGLATIARDYTIAGGTLEIELGGSEPGVSFDRVVVGGVATLGGTLHVVSYGVFDPAPGQAFDILTAAGVVGTFAAVSSAGVGPFEVQYLNDRVRLVFVATCDPDFTCDGNADQDDVRCLVSVIAGDVGCACRDPDFNQDGNSDQDDLRALIGVIAGEPCP